MSRPPDEKEIELLKTFRVSIKDCVNEKRWRNDSYLLRWIRARDHNLERAEEMLRNSCKWREQNNIDTILSDPISYELDKFFQCSLGGIDKEGRPVLGCPFGEWDVRNLVDNGQKDDLVHFLTQCLEILDCSMQEMWVNNFPFKSLWPHTQFTVIIDLNGLTYGKLMHKKSINMVLEVIKLYEAHYPETLGRAFVINAPRIFAMLYALIKPLLSAHTVAKIQIFDSKEAEWKKAILETVDEDQIPTRYGGNRTDTRPI